MAVVKKNVTLKMVAERVGCSIAVVSTVLNSAKGRTKVCDKTRQRVLEIAREMDYTPNYASQSLKANSSRTLGIYVQPKPWSGLANQYEMTLFRGIEKAAREANYDLLLLNISLDSLPELCGARLKERRIDGVLLLHCDPNAAWVNPLLDISSNVMALDNDQEHPRLNRIEFDNRAALFLAVGTLVKRGYRRIAFAGSCIPTPEHDALRRELFFLEAVREYGLNDTLVFHTANCPVGIDEKTAFCQAEGREALYYFRSLPEPPDAVITYNSLVGEAMLQEAVRSGMQIPQELGILSVDNPVLPVTHAPRLSTLSHPLEAMGYAGTEELIRLIRNPASDSPPVVRVFKPELQEGETIRLLS